MPFEYFSSKTWPAAVGLSCNFRQWRADSHCKFMHGYAISVEIEFRSQHLDSRNWVMDFGGLKPIRNWLEAMFDHTTLVAQDDPEFQFFEEMSKRGLIQMRIVPATGCERFGKMIYEHVSKFIATSPQYSAHGLYVSCVTVREHEGNAAGVRYTPSN